MTMAWTSRAAHALAAAAADRAPALAAIAVDPAGAEVVTIGCTPDTGFEIGSITKTMTGVLLADAVTGGWVSLHDPIGRWLDAGLNAGITLGQLATHTSGLPRLSPSHASGAPDPYAFLTAETAQDELRLASRRQPPAEYDYSNFGFQLLGLALERATATPFDTLISQRICAPLAMEHTRIGRTADATRAQGHRAGKPAAAWTHHLAGAGGVVATATDMAAYLRACLMPQQGPLGRAIALAQRPHHHIDRLRSAGLGWALGPPGYLGHDGATNGFRGMLGIKTADRRGAIILANDSTARGIAAAVRSVLDNETR